MVHLTVKKMLCASFSKELSNLKKRSFPRNSRIDLSDKEETTKIIKEETAEIIRKKKAETIIDTLVMIEDAQDLVKKKWIRKKHALYMIKKKRKSPHKNL